MMESFRVTITPLMDSLASMDTRLSSLEARHKRLEDAHAKLQTIVEDAREDTMQRESEWKRSRRKILIFVFFYFYVIYAYLFGLDEYFVYFYDMLIF